MARQEEKGIAIQVPDSELVLEGIFIRGEGDETPGAVIAPPHPLYGGSMDSPVLNEVAYACKKAGYATIRFNWRGVGASAGERSGEPEAADADYRAALAYLEETVPGAVIAAGYSFGAATAVRAAVGHPRVRRLVLVAPPPALLDESALSDFGGAVLIVVGDDDSFAPAAELEALAADRPRRRLVVVPGADHFFAAGLAEIGRAVSEWLDPV
jgi:alpha/beta superfamily hydrolase